ncbi:hypothetical protein M378DRAFT_76207 [Amanita muscaria Koide BX008]|uniref:Protein kinase domain-containing protein n=1 Tax=Amanita muscaria (strain Koide BX008) TaxID=946122 RepID=A0A0C2XAW3_AMAMK|nr:hypothetical protein M378DRAFT_76207 [Amanita muscaria Koide BX008]
MPREIVNDNDDPQQSQTSVVSDAFTDDDFEQLNALGEGAGGVVHRVKEKRTQKIMARKTITTREAPLKQLLRELQTTSSNKHPNIINFFGAYMSPSTSEVKILMEFCEGGSLEAVSKQIKERGAVVGEVIAARIAEGVLQGLAYLHSRKTIHRDIKPSNILLSQDGVIKLCDFGVSGELVNSLAGTFTGTSMYMAPERISGNEYSIRSDVWSMGISLLELAQNRFPFPNELPPIELMMHITQGDPPMLEDEGGVVWSDDMKDFIKLSLIHDQSVRPIPKDMLVHPWILKGVKEEVHMSRWIRQVWGWKPPKPKSREGYVWDSGLSNHAVPETIQFELIMTTPRKKDIIQGGRITDNRFFFHRCTDASFFFGYSYVLLQQEVHRIRCAFAIYGLLSDCF